MEDKLSYIFLRLIFVFVSLKFLNVTVNKTHMWILPTIEIQQVNFITAFPPILALVS